MKKQVKKTISQNHEGLRIKSFLDMIAPSVVQFNPDHFICGNTFRCVWALREYPTQTDEQALLRHLGEKDGITLRIYTRQLTPAEEKRIIQNAANKNRMGSSNTNDLQQTITAESNLQDMISMEGSRHRNKEPLFHCAVYIELTASDHILWVRFSRDLIRVDAEIVDLLVVRCAEHLAVIAALVGSAVLHVVDAQVSILHTLTLRKAPSVRRRDPRTARWSRSAQSRLPASF